MRPHPRIRKAVKCGGCTLAAVLLGLWVLACFCVTAYGWYSERHSWNVYAMNGRACFECHPGRFHDIPDGFDCWQGSTFDATWLPSASRTTQVFWFAMPLYLLAIPPLVLGIVAWRAEVLARRRAMGGKCKACGYDRSGLSAPAICPECGRAA